MKIKEKILKLGKRKNCFIALLLCVLLAFTILSGLNGFKSGKIEANAQTAPQTKNLDLNGVRYTYQTSLNELKNNGFFELMTTYRYITIFEDEGLSEIGINCITSKYNETQISTAKTNLINAFDFISIDNEMITTDFEHSEYTNTSNEYFEIKSLSSLNLKSIYIHNDILKNLPNTNEDVKNATVYFVELIYFSDNINEANLSNFDYVYQNSIRKAFFFYNTIDINIDIENIKNYNLRRINISTGYDETNDDNAIHSKVLTDYSNTPLSSTGYGDKFISINNISFIQNNKCYFDYDIASNSQNIQYKGNVLLSTEKYDNELFRDLAGNIGATVDVPVNIGKGFFGGYNENKAPLNYIYYGTITAPGLGGVGCYNDKNINSFINYRNYSLFFGFINPIDGDSVWTYRNQNQLLYLDAFSSLKTSYNNKNYAALSAQVEDILYNVNYVGDIEEMEFNEKVEEDFQNLLKLTGLGAFLGLVLGLIFGNPAVGAAIGAMWGALIALFPLLIDGLQALFGYNFLSGLYNFFKSITNFFANFVDTIINFFISIITNPFVLILIVIVAIIFVITYFQKK